MCWCLGLIVFFIFVLTSCMRYLIPIIPIFYPREPVSLLLPFIAILGNSLKALMVAIWWKRYVWFFVNRILQWFSWYFRQFRVKEIRWHRLHLVYRWLDRVIDTIGDIGRGRHGLLLYKSKVTRNKGRRVVNTGKRWIGMLLMSLIHFMNLIERYIYWDK